MNGVSVQVSRHLGWWRRAARGARWPFLLVGVVVVLGAGCPSATGPKLRYDEPPLKPFTGNIRGTYTIWLGDGKAIRDSFVLRCPNTGTARFSLLRRGLEIPLATVRDTILPPWNDDGLDPRVATPGLAWHSTWGISDPPVMFNMWGYYYGSGLEAQFVGRLRYTLPGPNSEVYLIHRGMWSAKTFREP